MASTSPSHPQTIPLTRYLFTRLHQLGLRSLHGVPGDYNLTALDHVLPCNLTWIGSCNELNAGYAADGYSRISGLGALITAFGVGELSAINAIGGAYAECSAVVHIVGTPPRQAQRDGICLHHSFGDGDFGVFARMARCVTVAQADLVDGETAVVEIDRVLRECVIQSRPVYITLPTDMVSIPVDATRLRSTRIPTTAAITPSQKLHQDDAETRTLTHLLPLIRHTTQPLLIIDGFTARHSTIPLLDQLARLLRWPTTSTPFGKSCIDETLANFHGIYAGIAGREGKAGSEKQWVDSCDLVLRFGGLDSDVNTYGFSTLTPPRSTVNFQHDTVAFGHSGELVQGIQIQSLLAKLIAALHGLDAVGQIPRPTPYPSHLGDPVAELRALPPPEPEAEIAQHDFWRRISLFFQEGDIILTETGTPSVGSREFVLPRHARLVNSSIWLSIGFMLPAAQGAALAVRDVVDAESAGDDDAAPRSVLHRPTTTTTASPRTILVVGDGSFQMSCQELSTVIRHRLDLIVFLVNNDGYTIERFIHGMKEHYNDVASWRYLDAPRFFGAGRRDSLYAAKAEGGYVIGVNDGEEGDGGDDGYKLQTYQARNWGELLLVLGREEVKAGKGLCMIEVFMGREDAPDSLKKLVGSVKRRNSGVEGDGEETAETRDGLRGAVNGHEVLSLKGDEEAVVEEKVMKIAG